MTADDALSVLRKHEGVLRDRGVSRAAIFGSTARGEACAGSDVDILVEIEPSAKVDLYAYVGITQLIATLFSGPVDIADHAMLVEPVRRTAERDALYAF